MPAIDRYDVVVVGSGEAGKYLAWTLSKAGNRTALIERKMVGGSCPNVACLPSKNIIHSAKVTSLAARASEFGLEVGSTATNMQSVQRRKRKMVEELIKVHLDRYEASGVGLIMGEARFVAPKTAVVNLNDGGTRMISGERVNERLETTAPGVWAVGDCAGSPQFTHVAYDDFRIVRDNLNGGNRTTWNRLVPYCMFTDPELAWVGLSESEAKSRGIEYRLAKMPMAAVLRTRTLSEPRGLIKMLIDKTSDRILGLTVFGAEASELMATVQTAMLGQLPFTVLRDAIFTHPTAAEGLTVLLADVATSAPSEGM